MANRNPHDSNELVEPPVFEIGQKVRSLQNVRNDGTYPGPAVGDVLIPAGAVGYVISIGSYLQMYHIYSVDFFEQRRVIGMRGKELEMVNAHANAPQNSSPTQPRGAQS
jgi:nitrogen fixation protein NifZ